MMSPRVKDRKHDQSNGANDGKENRKSTENLLRDVVIRRQTGLVTQPALADECEIERDNHDCTAHDEERLAPIRGSNVGNVRNVLVDCFPGVVWLAHCCPRANHGKQCACDELACRL